MTLDNFNDFLADIKKQDIKNLQYSVINYQNQLFIFIDVFIKMSNNDLFYTPYEEIIMSPMQDCIDVCQKCFRRKAFGIC